MSDSFAAPWTVAHQEPLSMGFPKQKHWIRLPFPSPGKLSDPGIKPASLALPVSHQGRPPVQVLALNSGKSQETLYPKHKGRTGALGGLSDSEMTAGQGAAHHEALNLLLLVEGPPHTPSP